MANTLKLTMFQSVMITCTSFLPLLFWVFPRYAAYFGGIDGQWAVLGTCLIGLFSAWVHGMLNQRFSASSGSQMLRTVYGKTVGTIFSLSFVPGYLLFTAVSLYSFTVALKSLLPNTPELAIATPMVLIAVMGARYGIETIARVAAVIFPVTLLLLVAVFLFIFLNADWGGITTHPANLMRTIRTSGTLLPIFFGLNVVLMINPFYSHKKRKAIWIPIISVSLASLILLFVYITTIRMVGYEGLRVLTHPIEFVMQLVEVRGLVVQRLGIFLVFVLTMFQVVFFANQMWAMSELVSEIFGLARSGQKMTIVAYALVVLIVFSMIPNQQVWDFLVEKILAPLTWIYLLIEPTVKLLLARLRRLTDDPALAIR